MSTAIRKEADQLTNALKKITAHFELKTIKKEFDEYGFELLLQNQTTGVKCQFSPREGKGWIVILGRLKDGAFPRHPIHISDDTQLDRFDIRDVATVQLGSIPELTKEIENDLPLKMRDIIHLLDVCCSDILKGNFEIFEELESIVKGRAG